MDNYGHKQSSKHLQLTRQQKQKIKITEKNKRVNIKNYLGKQTSNHGRLLRQTNNQTWTHKQAGMYNYGDKQISRHGQSLRQLTKQAWTINETIKSTSIAINETNK